MSLATVEALARGLGVRTGSLLGRKPTAVTPSDRSAAEILRDNLIHERARRKLTQCGLSEASGVPRSVIAAIERGTRNPALTTLARLAAALDTTVEGFLSEPSSEQ